MKPAVPGSKVSGLSSQIDNFPGTIIRNSYSINMKGDSRRKQLSKEKRKKWNKYKEEKTNEKNQIMTLQNEDYRDE